MVAQALLGCSKKDSDGIASGTITEVTADSSDRVVLDFATYPNLSSSGGSYRFKATLPSSGSTRFFAVTRLNAATVVALSLFCTHASCLIEPYDSSSQTYSCVCHGSLFKEDGTVQNGPAVTPLTRFTTALTSADITVSLS